MKRILSFLLVILLTLSLLCSCDSLKDAIDGIINRDDGYTDSEDGGTEDNGSESGSTENGTQGDNDTSGDGEEENQTPSKPDGDESFRYTDFTAEEKAQIRDLIGGSIPFLSNDKYSVEEYSLDLDDYFEIGINYYTEGNSKADFEAYKRLFSAYAFDGSEKDEYGDEWYYYTSSDGFFVDMCYYVIDGISYVDLYAYVYTEQDGGDAPSGDTGDGEQDSDSGYDILTNSGAGLPEGTNGVYEVDFTKGKYVKDVSDQGYYLDGCPTVGEPKVLVIPVEFSDATARSQGCNIEKIITAFCGEDGVGDYYSVDRYYYVSSYGRLDLDITVLDEWFRPENPSSYYENLTDSDGYFNGDQVVLDEALAYLSGIMDLSDYDSDGNGIIDAVVMINTLDVGEDDFHWAYRYWNYYTDGDGYYYEYDGVSANDYLWASYFFIQESYDVTGEAYYTDKSVINTYTLIHEFGHILGADDYYNTAEVGEHPMDGCDIMDGMTGDHNPYSKFNYGWLTSSRLVTAKDSVTLTLNSFTETGDSIIIANDWDEELGAYQEYYVVIYYTMTGLNGGDYGYFARDGIIVYHVNSTLYREVYEGEVYYDVYNNNTDPSDEYGSEDNLIEFVKSTEGNFTYVEGDSLPTVTDDLGNRLIYSFTVDSIDGNTATITFTKN